MAAIANPAPVGPSRAQDDLRTITVHLTPYAPGCRTYEVSSPRRWRTYEASSPEHVMRSVLTRLKRRPDQVRVRTEDPPLDCIELLAEVDDYGFIPVADIMVGMSEADVNATLSALDRQGWRPAEVIETPFA